MTLAAALLALQVHGADSSPEWLKPSGDCVLEETSIEVNGLILDMSTGDAVCDRIIWICNEAIKDEAFYNARTGSCPFVRGSRGAIVARWPGPKVCCRAWKEARKRNVPCDPFADADCDGIGNREDIDPLAPKQCTEPKTERDLMDPIWNHRQMMARNLEARWKQLEAAHQDLLYDYDAFATAASACGIEDIVKELLSAAGGTRAELVDMVTKMISGDLSYLGPGEAFTAADIAKDLTGLDSPSHMRGMIDDCSALSDDLRDAANRFIDNYELVPRLMSRVQELVSRIGRIDQQYWDQWHQYYRACVQWAACENLPLETCPAPPQSPSGPIPGQETTLPSGPPG